MCGIVGVASAGPMTIPMKEFFQSLLFHDVVRGAHATGVAAIDTLDRSLTVEKKAVPSPVFLEMKEEMDNLFNHKHNFNIYIGHNRYATVGDKTKDDNAHPFIHGNIVGVHNGSLRNQSLLDDHKDFVVDSDNLYHHLAKNGLEKTIEKTDGAYALVWYDKSDNSLNFIRNDERPLCIGKLTNGCWVWASEYQMLTWLVRRHKSLQFDTYMEDGVKVQHVYNIKKNTHVKFTFKDKSRQFDGDYEVKEYTPPEFPTRAYEGWDYGNYGRRYGSHGNSGTTHRVTYQSDAQKESQAILDKFLVGAKVSESKLELRFLGNIQQAQPGSSYKAKIALFEYRSKNGMKVLFHSFIYTNALTQDWGEDMIGATVYGTISSICKISGHTYEGIRNVDLGATLCLSHLSLARPDRMFPYHEEQEGAADNKVVPFRGKTQQETTQSNPSSTAHTGEQSQQGASFDQRKLRVSLANGFCTQGEFVDIMAENHHRCGECNKTLSQIPSSSLYLFQHFDQYEGKKFDYLMCSLRCHRNMKEVCDAIDEDYAKDYGANNA